MFKKLEIVLMENNGHYEVRLTKAFAPEHGGGEMTFREAAGTSIHSALDLARSMVTLSPTNTYTAECKGWTHN